MITWKLARAALPLVVIGLAILAVLMFWNGLAAHIPFTAQWRANRAEAQRDYAQSDAENRGLEVEGEREQAQRVETFHTSEVVIRDLTSRAETEARSAPDANTPLDPARADRLRAHDRSLCDNAPTLCPAAPAVAP